jgi:ABC-type sugar transport system ATPase subunit
MNTIAGFLQGTYQRDGLRYRILSKGIVPLLPAKWTSVITGMNCQDMIVGIRPEHIIPEWDLHTQWDSSFCTLKVEVVASEWNQGKTLARLHLPNSDDHFMAVFDISHDQVKIGQIITIAIDPENFCLFHPQTRQLIQPAYITPHTGLKL